MQLPKVVPGPEGFTVEGAGPQLLQELLDEYEAGLKRLAPNSWPTMLPGLTRTEITDRLGEIGLTPPGELLVWWQWHNGHQEGVGHALRNAQLSLKQAIQLYLSQHRGVEDETVWHPEWIAVAGGAVEPIAASCKPSKNPPLVRAISPQYGASTQDGSTQFQVLSLCTPLTFWVTALREGWYAPDRARGWLEYHFDDFPAEWNATQLM